MGPISSEPARAALAAFAGGGLGVRLHTSLRQWLAPLDELEALIPAQGRVLDLGCGHGLLSLHLVLASADRTVHGVDISTSKIRAGQAAARQAEVTDRVAFDVVSELWEPQSGAYDTVLLSDVLYLMDPATVTRTVAAACRGVRAGGTVVVKEVASTPRWKNTLGMMQEAVAVRVLRITDGDVINPRPLDTVTDSLRSRGTPFEVIPLHRGYPYAHTAIVARPQERGPDPMGSDVAGAPAPGPGD